MRFVLAAVAALVASAPSVAAVHSISVDLTIPADHVTNEEVILSKYATIPAFAVGDTVELTINLDRPIAFTLLPHLPAHDGAIAAGFQIFDQAALHYVNIGAPSFQIGGATGDIITSGLAGSYGPQGAFTPFLTIADPATFGSGSFTSVELTYDVQAAVQATNLALVYFSARAVPEPATWAMMVLGFGAAGSFARRRKLQQVSA